MNRITKKFISVLLSVLLVMASMNVAASALIASAAGKIIGGNTQEHVVNDYRSMYSDYMNAYFSGMAVPLDGSNGNPDMTVPGLNPTDDMIPQGLAYYPEKNWVLVSSYIGHNETHTNVTSVIYAMDFTTGKYVAKFNIYKANGSAFTGHAGGIAVSENNLYICDTGSKLSYIPLSDFDSIQNGTEADIRIAGTCNIGSANNYANTSYVSVNDGILWTGNFYTSDNNNYKTPANELYNSLALGYNIGGFSSSKAEWKKLVSMSDSGNKTPSYVIVCSNDEIYNIQSLAVKNNTVIIGSSMGRKNDSLLYAGRVALNKKGTVKLTLANGVKVNAYSITDIKEYPYLPMVEGIFWYADEAGHNWIYSVFESAAYNYYGYKPSNVCERPTDVIWKIDADALADVEKNCTCICHKENRNFIYEIICKICTFFWKLSDTNRICSCRRIHYWIEKA